MDSQTRLEHTLALAALVQAMVKELAEHFESGQQLSRYPYEMLDENKWLAARHGLEGELVDLPEPRPGAHDRARAPAGRPPARPRRGPGLGRRAGRHRRSARQRQRRPRARSWCSRPTTTCARWWGRSWRDDPSHAALTETASAQYPQSGEPARPLRRLQELRVRGQPVRHGVPVLRPAGAQARPQARARRRGRRAARQAAPPAAPLAAAPRGDRGDRPRDPADVPRCADRRRVAAGHAGAGHRGPWRSTRSAASWWASTTSRGAT